MKNIKIDQQETEANMETLKHIYNIKTDTKLIQQIMQLEIRRHWLK